MAEGGEETNKSEDASSFKLERARRKGMLARGSDLGFLSALLALAVAMQISGEDLLRYSGQAMRNGLRGAGANAGSMQPVLERAWGSVQSRSNRNCSRERPDSLLE